MFNSNSPSLADIAAVTDGNRNNNGYGDMGMMGGWWIIIIILALFGGFGNNNNGRNNSSSNDIVVVPYPTGGYAMGGYGYGGGMGFSEAAVQRGFDNQTVINKLDGLANGVCSLGYDQLAQMNGLGNTVQQTGWNLASAIRDSKDATMQGLWNIASNQKDCCCKLESEIQEVRTAQAADTCAITTAIKDSTRDIMQNDDANFRALNDTVRDGFCRLENMQKDAEIASLRQQVADCNLAKGLSNTAQFIINQVRPTPQPCFEVPNPYQGTGSCCGNLSNCC